MRRYILYEHYYGNFDGVTLPLIKGHGFRKAINPFPLYPQLDYIIWTEISHRIHPDTAYAVLSSIPNVQRITLAFGRGLVQVMELRWSQIVFFPYNIFIL